MQAIKTLNNLEQMIGKESVEQCFTEYFTTVLAQSKKYEDLQNHRAVMDDDEMWKFIESIGRTELYEELKEINGQNRITGGQPSSRYLKAIRVSLVAQGYDERWVDTTFRGTLENYYLIGIHNKISELDDAKTSVYTEEHLAENIDDIAGVSWDESDDFSDRPLYQQAHNTLMSMRAFGERAEETVSNDSGKGKIYSPSTYKTYWQHIQYFLRWVNANHPECTTLESAKQYVKPWLQLRTEQTDNNGNTLSAFTIHTESAALCKLFQIDKNDPERFAPPPRSRRTRKRSRIPVEADKHFSVTNNDELIRFCKGTGCRRAVLERLEGRDLWSRQRMEEEANRLEGIASLTADDRRHLNTLEEALSTFPNENWFIHHRNDKGGKSRFAPIIGPDRAQIIARMRNTKPHEKVWWHVNAHADIHKYRGDYAVAMYKSYSRNIEDIPFDRVNHGTGKKFQSDVYVCRRDEQNKRLDRKALQMCGKALGHSCEKEVAVSYLYRL